MSIETYKQINEELVDQVLDMKNIITSLEAEVLQANKNFFEERERRLEIEKSFQQLIKQANREVANVFKKLFKNFGSEENLQYISALTPPSSTKSSKSSMEKRRRSSVGSGVTVRSPVKTAIGKVVENSKMEPFLNDKNVSTRKNRKKISNLKNLAEESDKHMPKVVEISTDVLDPRGYRSAVDMEISPGDVKKYGEAAAYDDVKQRLLLNERSRATQIFNCSIPADRRTFVIHDKSFNASGDGVKFETDFSDNLQIHSTPHGSSSKNASKNVSVRPKRQCAPKKLAEPPLINKMRNEGGSKSTSKRDKKQK